ncbi:MAG: hypothetical protein OHK0046_10090 [Anaerolineae bacterium]
MQPERTPKFYIPDPEAVIAGPTAMALLESRHREEFEDIIAKYHLEEVVNQDWYPLTTNMDMFKEFNNRNNGRSSLVSIGLEVFATAALPEHIDTVEAGLILLQQIQELNTRGLAPYQRYEAEVIAEGHIRVTDRSPFPHDLVYGYLYGLVNRLRPKDADFTVTRHYMNPDNPDSDGAIYEIKWDIV